MVGAWVTGLAVVGLAVWAFVSVVRRRRERWRMEVARRGQLTVDDVMARIDRANRAEVERLSKETAVRRAREEDTELAEADTATLAGGEPAPLPVPAEETIQFPAALPVPAPRPPLRPRPYLLEARAATGRAGTHE